MVATAWAPGQAYLFLYRLCTLQCSFLICAASNNSARCTGLTDHPLAASSTLQQCLLIDLTEKRIASPIIANATATWNQLHFRTPKEDELSTSLFDRFPHQYYSCFVTFANQTIPCDFWTNKIIQRLRPVVLPAWHDTDGKLCRLVLWIRVLEEGPNYNEWWDKTGISGASMRKTKRCSAVSVD